METDVPAGARVEEAPALRHHSEGGVGVGGDETEVGDRDLSPFAGSEWPKVTLYSCG